MLAGCLWLSANLGELAYAARDMNQMLLAVGAVGIILLLALTRRLYEKVQNDAKSCACSRARWPVPLCWPSSAGCLRCPAWVAGWPPTSC